MLGLGLTIDYHFLIVGLKYVIFCIHRNQGIGYNAMFRDSYIHVYLIISMFWI